MPLAPAAQDAPAPARLLGEFDNMVLSYDHYGRIVSASDRKRAMKDVTLALKFAWNPTILKVRGALRLDDGDLDGAVRDAEAMLKIEPENISAFALRGAAVCVARQKIRSSL